ncbi:Bax inhibitor-1 family protein [Neisseria sp. Ec49-e6-T10]|uniref:Bax inhibitor-1 family protein n=1 Tax=Neisseria sp. Ec49-e6-T10 TaxID=3140744 RepID=UPI003EBB1755
MQDNQVYDYTRELDTGVSKRTVLQKTYRLLGLSFIPCALGAAIPLFLNFHMVAALFSKGWMGLILFFAVFYGLMFAINKNRYSNVGVALLMVFTFLMGTFLGSLISMVSAIGPTGPKIIGLAAAMTAGIFLTMSVLATRTKMNMASVGSFLSVGAVILLIGIIANMFLQLPAVSLALSAGFVIFSSVMIMWQTKAVIDGGETSHISAALTLFISIYNIFSSLVHILLSLAGED